MNLIHKLKNVEQSTKCFNHQFIVLMAIIFILPFSYQANCEKFELETLGMEYKFEGMTDTSTGSATRYRVKFTLNKSATRNDIGYISNHFLQEFQTQREYNAVDLLFYLETSDLEGSYDIAKVTHAPYGDLSRAAEVTAGDYSKHKMEINFISKKHRKLVQEVLTQGSTIVPLKDYKIQLSKSLKRAKAFVSWIEKNQKKYGNKALPKKVVLEYLEKSKEIVAIEMKFMSGTEELIFPPKGHEKLTQKWQNLLGHVYSLSFGYLLNKRVPFENFDQEDNNNYIQLFKKDFQKFKPALKKYNIAH